MAAALFVGVAEAGEAREQTGLASWYGAWHRGRAMANGCRFNPAGLSAASTTLPLGTQIRVHHLHTGLSVVVTITDRGPYVQGRSLDLSQAAARAIGAERAGVVPVWIEILSRPPAHRCR